ncbi:MAG: hypothetical protein EAZ55_08460 [Cytophagales bacterium]|nr:MAG: hypothetical protein EAZ55_08460 [Cytophagales bacterium]
MTLKLPPNSDKFKTKFRLVELELNSILEITQAINNNMPEEALYMMYKFTLRANLRVEKMAIYVLEEDNEWHCKVHFGTPKDFEKKLPISLLEQNIRDITDLKGFPLSEDALFLEIFDLIVPVYHKEQVLAYVLLENNPAGGFLLDDEQGRELDTRFVQTLSNIIIVAIENKKLFRKQINQEAMKRELEIAKKVQSMLFPETLPYHEHLKIKATYFPHDLIGGDYYDYIPINNDKFIFCIADVSGKGVPAALLMSNFQASLRTLARQTNDLLQIVEELNYQIFQNARGEHFITCFICIYDRNQKLFEYINAGHNPAFLFDMQNNAELTLLEKGTTVLGAFSPLPFIESSCITIENFLLFTYTDGITEARSMEEEEYGLDRLIQFMHTQSQTDLKKIHENLIAEIDNFRQENPYNDDITLLSCRIKPF